MGGNSASALEELLSQVDIWIDWSEGISVHETHIGKNRHDLIVFGVELGYLDGNGMSEMHDLLLLVCC